MGDEIRLSEDQIMEMLMEDEDILQDVVERYFHLKKEDQGQEL